MLHQGHLKELLSDRGRANFARGCEQHQGPPKPPSPTRTIQMIIGGRDDASVYNVKFTTTHKLKRSVTHERYDELKESIVFNMSDAHGLVFPHYDAFVIILRILDIDVRLERTSGKITFRVLAGGATLETTFHIKDQDMAYNAIIGRPWIHAMKAIPSNLYQVIKVPTPWGVFSIRGEQRTSPECYRIAQDYTYTQQVKGKAKEA
ncbi:PREDICTED: uncharacterized protein LOC109233690 [Nicotiana attenuata]|uniref:uncharacterized protein LOC109233690 n=1 Tax=Nicotiana attenuata TaxID=49451 RepID=UPI000904E87A|nr:PREDICTED: uncharacterized protein LOC109233690 [Nicotiana attenuata]